LSRLCRAAVDQIFKTSIEQVYGRMGMFSAGFGCTLSDAVQASCSAYAFFERKRVETEKGDVIELHSLRN
jgi:uncharacterized protein